MFKLIPWSSDTIESNKQIYIKALKNRFKLKFSFGIQDFNLLQYEELLFEQKDRDNKKLNSLYKLNINEQKNELWKTTCFEFFLKEKNNSRYYEFNLNPSGFWNFYRFSDYRTDMRSALKSPPISIIQKNINNKKYIFTVEIKLSFLQKLMGNPRIQWSDILIKPTLILKNKNNNIEYWAPSHPPGKADFHSSEGFIPIDF